MSAEKKQSDFFFLSPLLSPLFCGIGLSLNANFSPNINVLSPDFIALLAGTYATFSGAFALSPGVDALSFGISVPFLGAGALSPGIDLSFGVDALSLNVPLYVYTLASTTFLPLSTSSIPSCIL